MPTLLVRICLHFLLSPNIGVNSSLATFTCNRNNITHAVECACHNNSSGTGQTVMSWSLRNIWKRLTFHSTDLCEEQRKHWHSPSSVASVDLSLTRGQQFSYLPTVKELCSYLCIANFPWMTYDCSRCQSQSYITDRCKLCPLPSLFRSLSVSPSACPQSPISSTATHKSSILSTMW